MNYGICCVGVAPLRLEPGHRAEMVSQLLFGECVLIKDTTINGWIKVQCKADGYTGWCQQSHLQQIDEAYYLLEERLVAADWINKTTYNGYTMWLPMGSSLKGIATENILWEEYKVQFYGNSWDVVLMPKDEITIQQLAFSFLNTTYLWGGRSVFGIDCSGFTQMVYKFLNVQLLRDASQQATQGSIVNFLPEAACGDLAFFDDEDGTITHVGLLLNEHEIIHAAGKVRVDKIDSQGIINTDTGLRTQRLRIIKRYL